MDKRNWKIIYTSYEGMCQKAVELLYREIGALILRDQGVYTIHTLLCEAEKEARLDRNAVAIGLYEESALIRQYIKKEEFPADGYCIKVTDGPSGHRLALITAHSPANLFYGAVDFIDDYFPLATPMHGSVKLVHELFAHPLPDYFHASAPAFKKRSVFTWGHPINDYRQYIENMARLKLNQLIVWNDYLPLNAKDIVDYAHSYGIELIWGYAWGWTRGCDRDKIKDLDQVEADILERYDRVYRHSGADGIYFQSFTETEEAQFKGKLIARSVTDFVNSVSEKILQKDPDLKLIFGLHASSVKDHLEFISEVDARIEIMWEDCGSFPFGYHPTLREKDDFEETAAFTDRLLTLREKGETSLLFKGCMTLDWHGDRFAHQSGPYVMGLSSPQLIKQDLELLRPIWRQYQSGWLQNGHLAHQIARQILHNSPRPVNLGVAGQFAGGIFLPEALCAQILWDADKPYQEIFNKVTRRKCIDIV